MFNKKSNKQSLQAKTKDELKKLDTVAKALFPVRFTYENGVFCLEDGRFAKTYQLVDVNYLTADREGKESIFLKYQEFLNSMLDDFKITVMNRKLNQVTDVNALYFNNKYDNLDYLRDELNAYIKKLSVDSNSYIQEIFITVVCKRNKIKDANTYFARVESNIEQIVSKFGSKCIDVDEKTKLEILHNFYCSDNDLKELTYDRKDMLMKGYQLNELVCPDSFVTNLDYFQVGKKFGRAMVFSNFPQYLKDTIITDMLMLNTEMSVSVDASPVPKDKAIRIAENKNLANETNIVNYQRKQNSSNNWAADIPFDMQQQREFLKEFLEDLTTRDQRMFLCTITLVHLADSLKELDSQTEELVSVASSYQVDLKTLKLPSRQRDGLLSALPISIDYINFKRTFLTECLSVFMPFRIQDIIHNAGIVCGVNKVSGNLIQIDRRKLKNGNAWILGKPGAGKSFFAKQQILNIVLGQPDADVIIIDPEREYNSVINALGGSVINISSTTNNHINPFDINANYGDSIENPVATKSEFIISVFEQILQGKISGKHRSVIDRCVNNIYKNYVANGFVGEPPTFKDLYNEFLKIQDTDISIQTAEELALESEIFINGSLNTFAHQTNVNTNNNLICYDILDLGSQLLPVGMLVVLDSVFNRITQNRKKGKSTYIFIDEIYLLFTHEYTAEFLYKLWKRVRKYGGYCTGITQNVEDLLHSEHARTMLSNSEFVVMLAQATSDKDQLSRLLNISLEECKYITDSGSGEGIIHIEDKNIPFINRYTRDMSAYKLITTKPGESM